MGKGVWYHTILQTNINKCAPSTNLGVKYKIAMLKMMYFG